MDEAHHPQTAADHLRRKLKTRHLTMIAIGGSIGTGLFVASGTSIAQAGPGGALAAYALIGLMVYFLMTSLGEMAAYMPVAGSFSTYAARFVDPATKLDGQFDFPLRLELMEAVVTRRSTMTALRNFVDSLGLPVLGYLRNTQNSVQLAAQGQSVFDVAGTRVARDVEQWQGICDWLDVV